MTVKEAAAYLNIRPTTLDTMRWKGEGPLFSKARGVGIRYFKADLDEYLDRGRKRVLLSLPLPLLKPGPTSV